MELEGIKFNIGDGGKNSDEYLGKVEFVKETSINLCKVGWVWSQDEERTKQIKDYIRKYYRL